MVHNLCRAVNDWLRCAECDPNVMRILSILTTCNATYDGVGGAVSNDSMQTDVSTPDYGTPNSCFGLEHFDIHHPDYLYQIGQIILEISANPHLYIDCLKSKDIWEYSIYDQLFLAIFGDLNVTAYMIHQPDVAVHLPLLLECITNRPSDCTFPTLPDPNTYTVQEMVHNLCRAVNDWLRCAECDPNVMRILSILTTCNATYDGVGGAVSNGMLN
ncbi:uncharacterized protein LOC117340496 [Pecten maximus]|uniref:uncharacterized protein LOC117340496 n=1 Tax=Pecten maximus TaxID=6579 RepID=UPI0014580E7E|nr:uncharacterized protein LOC117340496 [Pecten maximus]